METVPTVGGRAEGCRKHRGDDEGSFLEAIKTPFTTTHKDSGFINRLDRVGGFIQLSQIQIDRVCF